MVSIPEASASAQRWLLVCTLIGLSGVLAACGHGREPLPEMVRVGEFRLVDQGGRPFGSEELRGKVYVASFIFTTCREICPLLTSNMANLQRRLHPEGLHYLSISVDPEHDTPEALSEYATRYHADTDHWSFLTGEPAEVRRIIAQRFRVAVGDVEPLDNGSYDINHEARFLLIDQQGVLRGLYATDLPGQEQLSVDVQRLLDES